MGASARRVPAQLVVKRPLVAARLAHTTLVDTLRVTFTVLGPSCLVVQAVAAGVVLGRLRSTVASVKRTLRVVFTLVVETGFAGLGDLVALLVALFSIPSLDASAAVVIWGWRRSRRWRCGFYGAIAFVNGTVLRVPAAIYAGFAGAGAVSAKLVTFLAVPILYTKAAIRRRSRAGRWCRATTCVYRAELWVNTQAVVKARLAHIALIATLLVTIATTACLIEATYSSLSRLEAGVHSCKCRTHTPSGSVDGH